MLRLLGLLVIVALAAFFTNPTAAKMSAAADAKLEGVTEAAAENVDIGGTIGGLVARGADGAYDNYFVASHYAKPAGENPLVECWGAFTVTSCSKVGSPE
ncbi:MAG: hypothetical protein SGJ23_07605 [Alphaproteobacteria bacterium]|nr:hypothetical protein [Alphaproteobacteria bacterium]